jgi:proline iminopeptidase
MRELYPVIEPYAQGMLDAGDGQRVYWETCGNPAGAPVVVLHGGPGSGCGEWHRRLFDPSVFRIVLLDQRGCGRSRPHAAEHATALDANTTWHLVADLETLREQLGIERWMVWGGSWGSVLALAYAQRHTPRVSGVVLWGISTASRSEEDWLFRGGLAMFFPEQWQQLVDGLPEREQGGDVVAGYRRLLADADPAVRRRAADAWCLWESATPDWPPRTGRAPRFADPAFSMAFARLVTHYVHHHHWLDDGQLLRRIDRLAGVPATLVNGRFDLQGPLGSAWTLHRAWPGSRLVVVENAGHSPSSAGMRSALIEAAAGLAPG